MGYLNFKRTGLETTFTTDTFTRTVSNGWGSTDTGQAWQTAGGVASDYSVGSNIGTMSVGVVNTTRRCLLPASFVPADVDLKVKASPTVLAAGGNIESSLMVRIDPNDVDNTYYYGEVEYNYQVSRTVRARIVKRVAGVDTELIAAFDVPGMTYAANSWWWIRFQAVGTRLRIKVWPDTLGEPPEWNASVTDSTLTSGRVGIRSTIDATNTNTLPVLINYDTFTAMYDPTGKPFVNEVTQINDNWDLLDSKLQPYLIGGSLTDLEVGQEYLDTNFRYAVHNGASARVPDDIDAAWSAWTTLPLLSPRTARSGFLPKWRNNSLLRMVELVGGLTFNAAADPWTPGVLATVNSDTSGAIPASMIPNGNYHMQQCCTSATGGTSVVSSGYVHVDKPGGNTYVRIRIQYLGGSGGGNFAMLDQIWWWY